MENVSRLSDVAKRLRQLQASSPTTSDGLEAWYSDSDTFLYWLKVEAPGLVLPSQVWMYLHDADIRAKDAKYRAAQDEMLDHIILEFERGRVPESTGISIPLSRRSLAFAALVLLVLAAYLLAR